MSVSERTDASTEALLLVWAARRTGVLEALCTRAGTPAEVAEQTEVRESVAARLLAALASLGLFERVGEAEYEPTNRALGLFATRDVRSVGTLPHALDTVEELVGLPETLETGVPPERRSDWAVHELGAHHATDETVVRACVTAAVRAAPDAETVVDVCGASGVYAAEFAARGLAATLVESAATLEALGGVHGDRIDTHAGTPAELAETFELAFLGDVLSGMDPAEARATLGAAADLLADGGTLVVVDHLDDGSPAALATEARGLAAGHGGAHDPATVREWVAEAGLVDVSSEAVPGTDRHAVVGHAV